MSIVRIQHNGATGSSVSTSASANGNLLVVMVLGADSNPHTVTDNAGNIYVFDTNSHATNGSFDLQIWYTANCVAGATTISSAGSVYGLSMIEYSGVRLTSPVDTSAKIDTTTGTAVSPMLTNSNAGSVLVVACGFNSGSFGPTGVTGPWTFLDGPSAIPFGDADYFPGSAGTYQTTFLPTATRIYASSGIAFLPAAPSIAFVQDTFNTAGGTSSISVTATSPVTTGNLIVITIGGQQVPALNFVASVTDNAGNTYIQAPSAHSNDPINNNGTDLWYCLNCIGGASVHVTVSFVGIATDSEIGFSEFSGASSFDHANNFNSTGALVSPSFTPSLSGELLVAVVQNSQFNPTGQSGSWIVMPGTTAGGGGYIAAYIINPPLTSQQLMATPTTVAPFASSVAGFFQFTPFLILTLTDSISSSDSSTKEDEKVITDSITSSDSIGLARGQNVSDSMAVTDMFSLNSDFLAQVPNPTVETLVNHLVPAEIKTYFNIQE